MNLSNINYFETISLLNLQGVNKILIVRLSSLGDILLTTPVIRSMKEKLADIKIDFLLNEQYADVLKYNPYLNNLYTFTANNNSREFNFNELIKSLKSQKYDLIIDLQNNFRSKKIIRKIKAHPLQRVAKFKKLDVEKFLLVKFKINRLKDVPKIPVRYAQTIENFQLDEKGLEIFIPGNIRSQLIPDEKYIGLAPGSRHFTKMWLKEYYIYLAKMLLANGFKVVLLGGKDDKLICDEISEMAHGSVNLCTDDNILQIAADMKSCKVIVCNDSGLMHSASAAGTPVLAFFGSTVKEFGFTPYKGKNLILENNSLSCRPCSHIGRNRCPKKHFNCMMELTPQLAFNQINLLLNS